MKNKMKFAVLCMTLLVSVSAFAQEINQKSMKKAWGIVGNLCQTVKLDAATRRKAADLTYARGMAYLDRDARMQANELTKKEYDALGKKISENYWKDLQELIPEDQLDAFLVWKSKPKEERE